jgi:hypothetical protein
MSDSYYGQPVIKEPIWTWEIPCYFFAGGLAGASATMAYLAEVRGERDLARRTWATALVAVTASPVLLTMDLGKPSRFVNMFRVFKVTSPMSIGSWILAASGLATAVSTAHAWTGLFPRASRTARPAAALLGLPLSTYTAALATNTAVPVWHDARPTLAFVFASGAAASAGGASLALSPAGEARAVRRVAVGGAVSELATTQLMERRLGELGEPYHSGVSGRLGRLAKVLTAAGAAAVAAGVRRPGAALIVAGAFAERWSIFKAGFASAADPKYVVGPQRARIERGETRGASRRVTSSAS